MGGEVNSSSVQTFVNHRGNNNNTMAIEQDTPDARCSNCRVVSSENFYWCIQPRWTAKRPLSLTLNDLYTSVTSTNKCLLSCCCHSPLAKLIADFWVVIGLKIGNQFCQGGVCERQAKLTSNDQQA